MKADPAVVTPGSAFLLSWQIDPALLAPKGVILTLAFPPGLAPLDSPVDAVLPAPVSLPITAPTGEISCRVAPDAQGPFSIQAALSMDGKLLAETKLELQEGGLSRVPPAGGIAEGFGGLVSVAFPQDAAGADLEVRIRRPLPESLPPTTLSGSPFEVVAVAAESKDSVTQFAQPLTITVQYDPARYAGQEIGLVLHYFDPAAQSWLPLPSQVDTETHTLSAQSDHLTVFDYDLKTWQAAHPPSLSGFQVSTLTGSANYSLPLELPPGPGGFQPALALSYDSQMIDSVVAPYTQASWVGMGWNLDAGSIKRDMHGTMNYTPDDSFSINAAGVSGLLLPGADGRYHTASESFWRIEYSSAQDSWTAYSKDGTKYIFGETLASRANFPSGYHYNCQGGNYTVDNTTWRWGLSKIVNRFGQAITFTYAMESQNKKHPCDHSIVTPTTLAMYLAQIDYPNGRYRVRFVREARSDYRNAWTYDTDLTFYQASRLKTIWVEHVPPSGPVETIRKYALNYVALYPSYTWEGGGKTFTLKDIQQLDTNGLGLPKTEFSYGALVNGVYDGLHLTSATNGYGGAVTFAYEAAPWRDVDTTAGKKNEQGNQGGCDDDGALEGWVAYPGGWVGCEKPGAKWQTSANGAVYRQGDESLFQPGGVYRVSAVIKNNANENSFIQVGIDDGQGVHVLSTNTLAPKNQAGSAFTFSGEYAVPANASRVRLYVNCGMSCTIQDNSLNLLPTRYRVTSKTLTSSAPSASYAFNYRYDEPAMNDAAHSAAVVTPTPAPTPTPTPAPSYYPAYSEFRGHARVEESDPYGRVTTSYFHQDDARKGQVAMQLTTGRSFLDGFESFQSGWSHSGQGSRQTLERVTGDTALSSDNPANDWAVQSGRTAALGNGQAVWLQFRRGSGEATLAGEVGTLGTSSYRRWGLVIGADGALKSQWISGYSGGVYQVLETSLGLTATANAWYGLLLIFDCDRLYGRVWQRDNPVTSARFEQSPGTVINASTTWKYRQWVKNGRLWLDDYNEGRVYSLSQTDYETAAPVGASGQVSPELAIYWPHPVRSTTWNFEGDGQYTARKTEYQYALADQLNGATQHQYGNLTRQVDYSWNGSVWTAYRGERTWYYWTDNATQYLVGLPASINRYACTIGVCDWEPVDLRSQDQYLYDGSAAYTTPPTNGKLTGRRMVLRWAGTNSDPRYQDEKYGYDSWGNQVSLKRYTGEGTGGVLATAGEQTTTSVYDASYHTYRLSETNTLSQATSWAYDYRYSVPVSETGPNGTATTVTAGYDTFGRMTWVTRPGEAAGQKTLEIDYLDGQTPYGVKLTQRITDALTQAVVKYYDGLGRVVEEQSLDAQVNGATKNILVYRTYDAYGQIIKQSVPYEVAPGLSYRAPDPAKAYTLTAYDLLGRVSVVTGTDGVQERRLTYLDLEVQELDAKSNQTRTLLDVWGRTVQVIPPTGPGVTYAYDTSDRLTSATYGAVTSTMQYDLAGRKVVMNDPNLGNWDYEYNALGSLTRQDDAKHQRTCLYYDTLNRLTKKHFTNDATTCPAEASVPVKFSYDAGTNGKGQRTGMIDDTSNSTSWSYDARGRMTQEIKTIAGSAYTTSWTYNSADGVATMSYPDGEVLTYSYLPQGTLDKLSTNRKPDGTSGTYYLAQKQLYDPSGRLERRDLGAESLAANPVVVSDPGYNPWTVDGGRMESLKAGVFADQDSFLDLHYDYDPNGNILSIRDGANSSQKQCFTYDSLNRLLTAAVGNNDATCSGTLGLGEYANETYTYEPSSGNLASKTGVGTYGYQDALHVNAVTHLDGVQRYQYDANGNMILRDPAGADYYNFVYDQENRLTQAKKNGAVVASLTYDGDGTRVKSVLGSATTVFVGKHYETSGGVVTKYYYAGAERIAQRQGNTLYWLLGDHLGSTSKVVSANGTLHSQQLYRPWGETRYTSGSLPTHYTYTGQYSYAAGSSSDFGLLYYGARFYDPYLNRWISPDSIVPEAVQGVQAWDRYAYSNNNPINRTDPTGHWSISIGYNISGIVNSALSSVGLSGARVASALDSVATAFDVAALAIDSTIAAGDIASAVIGATAGAGIAAPEGGAPVVVTGPAGALLGAGLFELSPEVRIGLTIGNGLATASTGLTALSDLLTGDTNDVRSLTISQNGFQYNHETMIGRDTLTSGVLSAYGWMSPIGVTSAPAQGAALLNDLGKFYIGPLGKVPQSIPIRKNDVAINWE